MNRRPFKLMLFAAMALPLGVLAAGLPPSGSQIAAQSAAGKQDPIGGITAPEINSADGFPLVWLEDYDAAREVARTTKKPLFVVIRCER